MLADVSMHADVYGALHVSACCGCAQAIQAQGHPPLFQHGAISGMQPGMGAHACLSSCCFVQPPPMDLLNVIGSHVCRV